jgi:predicted nucleic acid-binding protein
VWRPRTRGWPQACSPPAASPRVHDTWIAATALAHGAVVWTQDGDFTSFVGVDVVRV